jgi:hypothetical protein
VPDLSPVLVSPRLVTVKYPINNIAADIELIPLDSISAETSSQRDLERMHRSVVGTRRCASD